MSYLSMPTEFPAHYYSVLHHSMCIVYEPRIVQGEENYWIEYCITRDSSRGHVASEYKNMNMSWNTLVKTKQLIEWGDCEKYFNQ